MQLKVLGCYQDLVGTANHPILVVKKQRKCKFSQFQARRTFAGARWVPLDMVEENDYLVWKYPVRSVNQGGRKLPVARYGGCVRDRRSRVGINTEFCRLCGLYLAEGYLEHRGIGFCFHEDERDYIDFVLRKVKEIFSADGYISRRENNKSVLVRISSVQARRFFEQFGDAARNKRIPEWLKATGSPYEYKGRLAALICGMFEGDGTISKDGFVILTASEILAWDIVELLCKLGCAPSIRRSRRNVLLPNGKRFEGLYFLVAVEGQGRNKLAKILGTSRRWETTQRIGLINLIGAKHLDKPFLLRRVVSKHAIPYRGKVYNLTVSGDPSYLTHSCLVHNCGGAAVYFNKEASEKEVLGDKDSEIAFAFRFLRNMTPGQLAQLKKYKWRITPSTFKRVKAMVPKGGVERFYKFYYLKKGSFAYVGDAVNTGQLGHTIGLARLEAVSRRLKRTSVHSDDAIRLIDKYDSPSTFFYLDPPYPDRSPVAAVSSGHGTYSKEDLAELVDKLRHIRGKFVLSLGTEHTYLLPGTWHIKRLWVQRRITSAFTGLPVKSQYEIVASNYVPTPIVRHLKRHLPQRGRHNERRHSVVSRLSQLRR